MALDRRLLGRRIAVLAADGFEKMELTVPAAALRAACADVEVVSLRAGRIRGVNLHEPAARVTVDRTLADADPRDYDALLVPGGFIGPDLLRQSQAARRFASAFDAAGKPVATLGHGSWLLASAGIASGRTLTSWPGIRDDLVHAGATWLDQPIVRDGNWLTSRGPQDLPRFVAALLDHFAGTPSVARRPQPPRQASAPQPIAPPRFVVGALQRLPRRTIAGGAIAVAVFALVAMRVRRRRSRPLGWAAA
ncbi:MAG: type 1 glutamine amidotransferase [Rhizobacter sp.]|nr:type 1 glutamine amidotransferase [Rhizobacter sp.]